MELLCLSTDDFGVISGFLREIDQNCVLLGYYAASSGNFLPTFRDNLSVASPEVKNKKRWDLLGCPETSVRNGHYSLLNNPGERSSVRR